jgi:hypothetical protein
MEHEEVDEQQNQEEAEERDPLPRLDVKVDEVQPGPAGGKEHYLVAPLVPMTACAAASRAMGTRYGEHET